MTDPDIPERVDSKNVLSSNGQALDKGDLPGKGYRMAFNFNSALFKVLVDYLKPEEKERILDLGCSRGYYVKAMEDYTSGIIGVDISEDSLRNAVTARVKYGDITNLDFAEGSFDKVYSLHTIEHLPDLGRFFSEIARVLKPGGTAIIIYPWELFRGMQAIGAAIRQYRNPLLAKKIHLHRLTPKNIGEFIAGTPLAHRQSKLVFAMGIQYMTILTKGS
ncbi:MAG: class I SAM-dependent methyltransferase [Dehalococcoidales bacterium]|nr:class I SAM-dependent methyltransferase [Dehalococcoidales bacterium]